MKRIARRLSLSLLVLLPAFFLPAALAADTIPGTEPPVVLIINSYNIEYLWTADITDGIMEALTRNGTPYRVYTEFLDWKRFPDERLISSMADTLAYKYRSLKPAVLITSDDKALEFAVRYRKALFDDAPIVFTGVYREAVPKLTGGAKNITGVYEDQDIRTTLKFAFDLQPSIRAAYIISDLNESGIAVERRIHTMLNGIAPRIPVTSLSNLNIEIIENFVTTLDAKDLLIVGTYSIDKSGRTYTGEALIGRVARAAKTPVYVLNTHQLGTGAFGGSLFSPALLGKKAADLAVKILAGTPADSLSPVSDGVFTPLFDYETTKRLQVNSMRMPINAVFLNREIPFVIKYRFEMISIAVIFLLLLLFIDILLLSNRKTRRYAKDLSLRNDEITQLNETLLQSDEELREQYNEIALIKESLQASEEQYRLSSIGSNDALWDWDYQKRLTQYSDRWFEFTGYSPEKHHNIMIRDILHPEDRPVFTAALDAHLENRTDHIRCEVRIHTGEGNYKWIKIRGKAVFDGAGEPVRIAGSITDIDDQKQKEAEIENLAYYDQLTSLPNRVYAIETSRKIIESLGEGERCGLMIIDIDNFKFVNDTYGHAIGDQILIHAAKSLASLVNEHIHIARIGGDEFLMLVENTSKTEMEKYGKLTLKLLSRKMQVNGRDHFLTVSGGISLFPDHASSYEELFQKADAALHRAKMSGKTRFHLFDEVIQHELIRRMELENGLRTAIDNNELYVAYQPQVNLKTGKIDGLEALARWSNPRLGEISPGEFIPIAEESGQIEQLGFFVIRSAMSFIKRAESLGHRDFSVSVNVSVKQMQEAGFVERILRLAKDEEVDTSRIALEITESFLIENLDPIIMKLEELKEAGFMLSLDDFGKGYSSLSYLKSLPIHYIKIDKTFIDDIISGKPGIPLAQSIISISHQLGLKVVAEGVECVEQINYLRDYDCDLIQGFYYSRPGKEDTVLGQLQLSFN